MLHIMTSEYNTTHKVCLSRPPSPLDGSARGAPRQAPGTITITTTINCFIITITMIMLR